MTTQQPPISPPLPEDDAEALARELHALREEVARLNRRRIFRMHDSLWRLGLFQLYRGLAFGLGSVLGATLLVSIVVRVLASMDFIPLLGDWIEQVIQQINQGK